MVRTIRLLNNGFESSTTKTPEFKAFARTFKNEFTEELKSIGAEKIEFSIGHFCISGFFTLGDQAWYFSLSDVRGAGMRLNGCDGQHELLYRTAQSYTDYTGGGNRWIVIHKGMARDMRLS